MALVIVLALAALAVVAWQQGLVDRGPDEGMRTVYEAGASDQSGGELIVTDPDAPRIEGFELPKTAMTPVRSGEEANSAPADGAKME